MRRYIAPAREDSPSRSRSSDLMSLTHDEQCIIENIILIDNNLNLNLESQYSITIFRIFKFNIII